MPREDEPLDWDSGRLTVAQRRRIDVVLALLEVDDHAPTAIRDAERATRMHIADSLAALELEPIGAAERIADLGSGAGFPGIPLAIAVPTAEVSLVESQRRRCEFMERICSAAEVTNAHAIWSRAEDWREGMAANDVVVARALAAQPVVLEYAAPLLRLGGALVDWRGRRAPEEERVSERAAAMLGMRRTRVATVAAFEGASEHHLHVFLKVDETPARFPRRAGLARKRPLGG
jgi:16S rRNA (guanine527-N7)-methyltransferase